MEQLTKIQISAFNDCKAGVYDKWYRYNHIDDGFSYDAAWCAFNCVIFLNDNVCFIECN